MPLITRFAYLEVKDKKQEEGDELKEVCLQAFESFVRRCPKEISSHVPTITNVCLKYLSYDPNYNYDSDGMDDEDMEMDNEEEEADTDGSYSDDDDMKREENVKVDIFNAYIALLKQTRTVVGSGGTGGCDNSLEYSNNISTIVREQVPSIVKSLHKQLREKSIKTRQSCFSLLSELVSVLPGALTEHISNLIPGVLYSLSDKNSSSNMKIDTLAFVNIVLKNHSPDVFHKHIHILLPAVINAVSDSFYKITSEALLVLTQITKIIRPFEGNINTNFNFVPFIKPIYEATFVKLKAADIDQEVKERAITCMGQIVYTFGDHMQSELQVSLPLLLDRLRNEITRLTCVKAITKIASSQFKLNLNPILPEAFPVLASFLRKNQRALKLSSLLLIDTLVKNYSEYLSPETIGIILNEVPPLINESDLHISQLTLNMLTSLIRSHLAFLAIIPQTILPEALVLVRSPLLQGSALNAMLEFFQAIVQNSFPGLDYEELVARLTQPITQPNRNQTLHKQAFHSIAKCMSAISIIEERRAIAGVQQLLSDIRARRDSDTIQVNIQVFALLAVGEIGKTIDLSSVKDLKDVIMESFNSTSEEVKSSASFCLGSVSVGNLEQYLPFVLSEIQNRQKRQYLLLHSLKEIISCQSANPQTIQVLEPHLDSVWKLLLNHCECPEEGTRNVVAECLGKLTLIDPTNLLPRLQQYLRSESPLARSTVVTAMKFTISDQPQKIDSLLRTSIGDFLKTLQDPDINVRRVALVAFNSAAHNKPLLIRDLLDSILPQLYNETKVRKELIREVEMGPFKHTVDDGLDIRKAAFECMYTLLDSCLDRIDIFEFLNHVEDGLRDHYDIKMLTYLMLVRLSTLCPSAVLQRLEGLVEPLKSTCIAKVKANAVKQEFEKQDELKRSAMRAFLALLAVPDADKNILMTDFLAQIKSTQDLSVLYDTIQKDSTVTNDMPMDCN
ncbi:unnamed protein product [Medioppia subpectinata]|uniref:TATA-binding protein interacting (TIP20) domain-containing protein n=1 Tax=Medioppia subpectinata TaxID=1979941 RepID=A0A7R9L0Q3_9ACAR|nr:unnamed protein product [Medioppia subpectinata]CAG2112251.1 unnamed protein product [Medioppia subpectinata]